LQCYYDQIISDDRDGYPNKKVESPGNLLGNLFRYYFSTRCIKEMKSAASKQDELAKTEVELMSDLEATRKYASGVDTLTTQLDSSLAAWREATRASFKGVQLPAITTVDGKTYTAVTINGVTDENLIVEHSGGMETIPVMQLPVSLRKNIIHEATVLAEQGL
jgi:hypothetical protein